MRYLLCYLPGGNYKDWPLIEEQLKKRDIKAEVQGTKDGRGYRIPETEWDKLPCWGSGTEAFDNNWTIEALPVTDDNWHSLYPYHSNWARLLFDDKWEIL